MISASDIGDKILYAKWTANMYTVTFETNGGSAIGDILYTYGIGFDELPIPVRDGYTFIGWYINGDLTGETMVSIAADDTGDFTLYAGWALKTYTVNFETNGGGSVGAITINHGETLTKPSDPERDGYVFMGWYSDPACTQLYDFDRATSGNITLYAGWEKEETTGCGSVIVSGSIAVFGGSFIFVTLLFVINKKRTINQ